MADAHDYAKMDIMNKYAGVSWKHLFGCDELGRIFLRCLYGAGVPEPWPAGLPDFHPGGHGAWLSGGYFGGWWIPW